MRVDEPFKTVKNPHKHNVADFFSHCARYWEEVYEAGRSRAENFTGYAKNRRKRMVLENLDAYAGRRRLSILDVGCGPGVFMEEALRRGHAASGIDISEEMVRSANERLKAFSSGVALCRQGDIENLPCENETVDVVLCLGVLPYLKNDRKAVRELDRVLKRGGMVLAVLPNLVKLGNMLDPYYYLVRMRQYLWYRFVGKNRATSEVMGPDCFAENRIFNVRRYSPMEAGGLFGNYGKLPGEGVAGIDYGPLTIWRRRLLPDSLSIKLSEYLGRRSSRWKWLNNFANEWVICFIKP